MIGDWPPTDPSLQRMIDGVIQTMNLNSPDYTRIRNLPTAPRNLFTAGTYPITPAVGSASQAGGTGPTITAVPHATSAAAASPAQPAQPAGAPAGSAGSGNTQAGTPTPPLGASPLDTSAVSQAARAAAAAMSSPASGPAAAPTPSAAPGPSASLTAPPVSSLPQTIAAGQASGVPSAPLASLWDSVYGNAGSGERGGGGSPTLNPQTRNSVWSMMQQYGEGGRQGGVGGGPSGGGPRGELNISTELGPSGVDSARDS